MKKVFGLLFTLMILLPSVPVSGSEREDFFSSEGKKFYSLGLNVGSSFATPLLILNLNATISPLPYSFLEFGAEYGFVHGMAGENVNIGNVEYSSNYIYARINIYVPYGNKTYDSYGRVKEGGGWYLGMGMGRMNAEYAYIISSTERTVATIHTPTLDAATGFYMGKGHILFKLGYAIRSTMDFNNLIGINHRFLLGINYRIY